MTDLPEKGFMGKKNFLNRIRQKFQVPTVKFKMLLCPLYMRS